MSLLTAEINESQIGLSLNAHRKELRMPIVRSYDGHSYNLTMGIVVLGQLVAAAGFLIEDILHWLEEIYFSCQRIYTSLTKSVLLTFLRS